MNKLFLSLSCGCLATAAAFAQAQKNDALPPALPPSAMVLHTGTQLVLVDVVVEDKDGQPVHGLKREDFVVTEDKKDQSIRSFEEISSKAAEALPPLPAQAPGVFSNYTPTPSNGPLNVLLLDTLNTPITDQAYVRTQLQQFVKKSAPGTRIAIVGLANKLYFLQGFTTDPGLLKAAVDRKMIAQGSSLLDDPAGTNGDTVTSTNPDLLTGVLATNLANFDATQQDFIARLRKEYTLDAFNQLARYLGAFPGRKNVIWFSASFPLTALPNPDSPDPFAGLMDNMTEEYRQTINLLARAEVSIYPVDARGLMSDPSLDAAASGAGFAKSPQKFSTVGDTQFAKAANEQLTMQAVADDTGGQPFFNTNDLASAVSKSIDVGSNYYSLSYSPTNHNAHGEYRSIRVALKDAGRKGLKLSYRQGYFADENGIPAMTAAADTAKGSEGSDRPAYHYAAAAMSRGAPEPEDIVFRARVLPASKETDATLAPDNQANPKGEFKPPYQRYDIDISAPGDNFAFMVQNNGNRVGGIEFLAFVYAADGTLLNAETKSVRLRQTPADHEKFVSSKVGYHLEVDAPAKGESFLRIGVHDLTTDSFGVVEVPTSSVNKLEPPVYPKK